MAWARIFRLAFILAEFIFQAQLLPMNELNVTACDAGLESIGYMFCCMYAYAYVCLCDVCHITSPKSLKSSLLEDKFWIQQKYLVESQTYFKKQGAGCDMIWSTNLDFRKPRQLKLRPRSLILPHSRDAEAAVEEINIER